MSKMAVVGGNLDGCGGCRYLLSAILLWSLGGFLSGSSEMAMIFVLQGRRC
ncbi:hypothetical protein Hanom_Chr08g00725501 [Helianthus anomalus]